MGNLSGIFEEVMFIISNGLCRAKISDFGIDGLFIAEKKPQSVSCGFMSILFC